MISADAARNVVGIIGKLVRLDWDLGADPSIQTLDRSTAGAGAWFEFGSISPGRRLTSGFALVAGNVISFGLFLSPV